MNKSLCFIICMLFSFALTADFALIIPDKASIYEKTAAEELSLHLRKATGKSIRILAENQANAITARKIYINKTDFARKNQLDFSHLGPEEWLIKAIGKDSLVIGGGFPRGILYGVFEFLEREIGVVWADEHFTYIPENKNYMWKDSLFITGKPSFEFRGTYAYFKHEKNKRITFMARNRENLFTDDVRHPADVEKYGVSRVYGSPRSGAHTFYFYTKDWGENERDCLSLNTKGQRLKAVSPRGPGQVCFTNPRTRDLFEKKLREYIISDRKEVADPRLYPRIYMISHNDNGDYCVCRQCSDFIEKHGASSLLLDFINDLARRIRKDYPDIYIQTTGYAFASKPPESAIRNEPNVISQYAAMGSEFARGNKKLEEERYHSDSMRPLTHSCNARRYAYLKTWSKLGKLAIWDYWVLFEDRRPVPVVFASALAENLKIYHSLGTIGLMAECERPMQTSFYALRLWLGYRLLNNIRLNPDEEINRFMNAYYGKGAPSMRKLLDCMQKHQDSVPGRIGGTWLHDRTDFDSDYIRTVNTLLDEAEKAADSPQAAKHIGFERCHIDLLTLDLARLSGSTASLPLQKIFPRLRKNYYALAETYLNPKKQQGEKNAVDYYIKGFSAIHPPLPPELNLKQEDIVADIFWPEFQQHYWGRLSPDEEAAGGHCLKASAGTTHRKGLQFGFYCNMRKKQIFTSIKDVRKTASNEKYNFYLFPGVTLSQSCYMWAHWTWTLQVDLSPYWRKIPPDTPVDIYLSLKFEGPDYFQGSSKANAVSLDRVIVVKQRTERK